MKNALFCLLLAALPLSASAADHAYVNQRFGFELSYPAERFAEGQESDNGDGIRAVSRDGKATLIAYGSHSPGVFGQSLEDVYNEERSSAGRRVTYQRLVRAESYFVISGFENGEIFYIKAYVIDGILKALDLRYPESARAPYDSVTAKVSRSFRPR